MNNFYVYLHRYASGPKIGEVFYVGKGCGKRASSYCGRNPYWKNIVNKYGFVHELAASDLTEDAVRAFARERLAGYKSPKQIVFRDELPKTNVGKVLRRALRDGQ